jgi:hypothetical protein
MLTLEASTRTLVVAAFNRLLVKLRREQLPIHSEIVQATLIYPP